MAWMDTLFNIGKEILGSDIVVDVVGAAAKTFLGGGSGDSAATQTQNALLQSTLSARKTAEDFRAGLTATAIKGFAQPSPHAKPVSRGNAADILASLVTQDDVKAFYLAMSRDQQRAQQQGTRNQTA